MEETKKVLLNVGRFYDSGIDCHTQAVVILAAGEYKGGDEPHITLVLHNHFDEFAVMIYRTDDRGNAELTIEGTDEIWADGDLYKGWYDITWHQDEDEGLIETRKLPGGIPEFLALVNEYYERYKEFNKYSIG